MLKLFNNGVIKMEKSFPKHIAIIWMDEDGLK